MIGLLALLFIWYTFGLPLGPGVPMFHVMLIKQIMIVNKKIWVQLMFFLCYTYHKKIFLLEITIIDSGFL